MMQKRDLYIEEVWRIISSREEKSRRKFENYFKNISWFPKILLFKVQEKNMFFIVCSKL